MSQSYFEKYNEGRIIAVLDVQGFSPYVKEINDEHSFEKAKRLITLSKLMEGSREEKRQLLAVELAKDYNRQDIIDEAVDSYECVAISDTIVISYALNPIALLLLIKEISLLQWDLIWKWGFLSRGYIGHGELYHKSDVIFGKGFIDCFNMCEKNDSHKNPCTIIDEELLKFFKGSDTLLDEFFREYSPGFKRLDYTFSARRGIAYTTAKISSHDQLLHAKRFVNSNLMDSNLDDYIRDKYVFTKQILDQLEKDISK